MYTVPVGTEPSPNVIKEAIAYNETLRSRYDQLESYYLGKHRILNRVKKDTTINNRLMVNHAKYITDVNVGYLLGNPASYSAEENIEAVKDEYKKQTISDLDHEIAKDVSIFGIQYELVFTDGNTIKSKDIDVRSCVVVYDDSVEHKKLFAIIYKQSENKKWEDIDVYDFGFIYKYVVKGEIALNTIQPHYFGDIPVIVYRNNSEEMGDFEPVTSIIDAYNVLQSDRVNDKEQLVDALLVIKGATLTPEQRALMRESRMLTMASKEVDISYLIKQLNEADADTLRQVLENDIHKISMTPNLSDQNFVGNASGVAIRYKLLAFEQSVSNKERYFEKGLKTRFGLYNNYLATLKKMPLIESYKVDVVFKRNLPQNDLETSQMIANLSGTVDKETLVSQLSFVDDVKAVLKAVAEEENEKVTAEIKNFGTQFATGEPIVEEKQTDNPKWGGLEGQGNL